MQRKLKLSALLFALGLIMVVLIYSTQTPSNQLAASSNTEDPLVTQSYVDRAFLDLETRLAGLETRINALSGTSTQNQTIQVIIDGKTVVFPDQKPVINASTQRMLVPIRPVLAAVGATFDWQPTEKKATIHKDKTEILLWIGKNEAQVDQKSVTLDQSPLIMAERTMVPLRFCSEGLGYQVDWDPEQRLALIKTTP